MADAAELASVPDAVADVEDLPRALCPRVPFVRRPRAMLAGWSWMASSRGLT